jgi:steroid delta-isomerase-like uncharacterized protein
MDDGTVADLGPGDIAITPPGHDALVVGDSHAFSSISRVLAAFQNARKYKKESMVMSGVEGVRLTIAMYLAAFPDLNFTLEDMVAEGDKVVAHWTLRGTHQGASLGMPPTGKHITLPGISILRLDDGKAVETWVIFD